MPGMIKVYVTTDDYSAAPEGYYMSGSNAQVWADLFRIFDPFQ